LSTIGIKEDVVGLVVNSASRAIKGLSVAPGKIDPGFNPNHLTLVMTNLSKRSIDLKAGHNGDKIAAISFFDVTEKCIPTKSTGWGDKPLPQDDYTRTKREMIRDKIVNTDYTQIISGIIVAIVTLILTYYLKVK